MVEFHVGVIISIISSVKNDVSSISISRDAIKQTFGKQIYKRVCKSYFHEVCFDKKKKQYLFCYQFCSFNNINLVQFREDNFS